MSVYHSVLVFGGNDYAPRGSFQLAYAAFSVMIGTILNANLFGQLAVIISAMNLKASKFQEKFDSTTTTMTNLSLPEKLQSKVTDFLTCTQKSLDQQNELKAFLDIISPSLRSEVVQHIFRKSLKNNAIFNYDVNLIDFLTKKLETSIHLPEDEIVTQGQDDKRLFFIAKGELVVLVKDHNSVVSPVKELYPGEVFGEISLL
jgi:CRP-like cAMP-binding protein